MGPPQAWPGLHLPSLPILKTLLLCGPACWITASQTLGGPGQHPLHPAQACVGPKPCCFPAVPRPDP